MTAVARIALHTARLEQHEKCERVLLQENWERLMVQYMRRNAERQANMFVVSASTPAQLFHALRRQMNRPFLKCAGVPHRMSMAVIMIACCSSTHGTSCA